MSWKKFGGTDKLDKMNMMNVNYISTDALSTSSPYVGDFDINGELTVYKKSFLKNDTDISGELIVSKNVKIAKNIDISGDITIDGQIKSTQSIAMTDGVFAGNISVIDNTHLGNSIYYDATFINNINQNPHGFLKGTQQSIGINTFTPQYTVDISGGSQLFRAYTNNSNSKSVLLETKSNQPQSKNTIQLFSDLSMVGMQFDYNGDTVGNIFMDENTFTIHTASYMDISSDHITIGKNEGYTGNSSERMTVYDNAVSQYLNNSESILGQSISCIAQDNSSVTFVSLLTPAQVGAHIGGGAYPFDKSKAYGAITLNENEIPALSLLQSDHSVQNRTSIGINTYTPKTNKYILDVNGPVHIENGQIEKVLTTQFEIKTVPKSNVITPNISVYGAPSTISSGSYIKKAYSSTTNGEKWSIANIITGEETFTTSSNAILSSYTYINGNQRTDLIAGEGGYIFKKELNDATWTFIGISQAIVYKAVWMDAFHYYGCTNSTLYRYVNSTYTRSFISISTYITNVNAIYGFRNSNNTIIVIVGNTGIYSTSNFSSTLTTINNTNIYYDVHSLLISNVNHVIAVGDNIISVSINNGSTWTHQSSPHQWKSVYISPTFAIIGGDNGALKYSAYPYTTWYDIPESILNSSGNKNILSNINIKHLTMTDANTLLLNYTSTVYDLFTNTLGSSSIYYLYLPQLFNPYDNFVFDISGSTHLDGDVFIKRNIHTKNIATFEGNVESTSYTSGTVTVVGGVGIVGNTNISRNVDIGKTAIIRNTDLSENALMVFGNTVITNNTKIYGNADISQNLRVSSVVDACLNSYPYGALIVNGGVGIQKNAFIGNSVNIENSARIGNALTVGNTITTSQLIINGDDAINYSTGAIQLVGGMGILGNLYVKDLTVTGNTINDNETNMSSLVITSNLNATDISSGAMIVYGGVGIQKDIYMGGNAYLLQSMSVFEHLDISKNLTVEGNSHFMGTVTIDTSINLLQNQTVEGNVIVQGDSIVNNLLDVSFSRIRGKLDVSGDITVDGNLIMNSNAIINQNIQCYGNIDVSNVVTITNTNNAIKNGDVGSLHTYGGAMVEKNMIIYGNVDISNTLIANSIVLNGQRATNYRTGAIQLVGGMGISGELYSSSIVSERIDVSNMNVLKSLTISSTTQSINRYTGALTISGGVGIEGNTNIGGNVIISGNTRLIRTTDICGNMTSQYTNVGRLRVREELDISGTTNIDADLFVNFDQFIRGGLEINGNTTMNAYMDASFGRVRGLLQTYVTDSSFISSALAVDVSGRLNVDGFTDLSSGRVRSRFEVVNLDMSNGRVTSALDISGRMRVTGFTDLSGGRVRNRLEVTNIDMSFGWAQTALDISGRMRVDGFTDLLSGRVRNRFEVVNLDLSNGRVTTALDISGRMTVDGFTDLLSGRVRNRFEVVNLDMSNGRVTTALDISGRMTVDGMTDLSSGRVRSRFEVVNLDLSNGRVTTALDISGRMTVDGFTDLLSGRVRNRFEVVNLDMSNGRVTTALDISGRLRVDGFTDLSNGRVRSRFEVVNLDMSNGRVTTALDISGRMTVDGFTDLLGGRVRNRFEVVNLDMSNGRVTTALDLSGRLNVDGFTDLSSGRVRSRFEVVNLDISNGRVTTALDISGRMTVDGFTDLSGGRVRNRFEVSNLDVSNGNVTTTLNILGNLRVDGFTDLSYGRVKNALDVSSMDVGYHNVWGQLDVIGNCRIRSAFMTNVDISFVKVSLLDVSGRLTVNGFTDLSSGRVRGRFEAVNLDMSNGRVTTALDLSGRLNVDGFTDLSSGRVRSRFEVVNLDMSNGRVTTALDISGRMTVDGFTDLSSGRVRSRFEAVNLDMSNGRVTTALDISGRMTVDGFTDLLSGRVRNRFEVVNLDLSNGRVTTALDISGRMTVDGFTDLSSGRVRNRFEVVNLDLSNGRVTNTFDVSGNVRADGFTDLLYGRVRGAFDISGNLTVDGRTIVAGIYARNQLDVSGNVRIDGSSDLSYVRVRNRFDVSGNVRIDSLSNIYGIYVPTNADISGNVRIDGITDLASSRVRSRFDVSGDVRMDGFTDLAAGRVRNRFDVSGNVRMDGFTDISGLRVRNRFDVSGNVRMDDFTDLSYARVRGNLEVNGMDIFSNITTLNTRTTNFSRGGGILTINSNVTIPADKNFIFGGLDGNIRFNNIENKLVNITNTNTNNTYDLTIGNFTNNNTIRLNSTASITLQVPTVNIIGNADLNSGNIGNVNTISLKAGGDIQINNVSMNTRLESVEMKTYDFNYDTTSGNVLTIGNTYNYDVIQLNANTDVILAPVNGHIKLNGNIDAMGNNIGNVNVINVNAGGDIQIGGTSITSGGALLTSSNTWSGDINRFKVLTASGYLSVSGDIVATGNTQVSRRLAVSGDSSLNGFTDLSGGRVKNNFVVGSYNISNEFSRLSRIKWGLDNCWNITKNANESLGSVMNFGWDGTTGDQFDNYYVNYHAIRSVEEIGLRSKQINLIGNTTLNGNTTTLPRNRFLYALGDCSFSGNIDASYAKVTNDINVFGYSAKYEFGKLVWTVFSNWSTYWESNETSTVMNLGWNGNQNTSTESNYVNYLSLKSNYTIGLKSPMILVNGESIFTGNLKVNAPTDISLNSVNGNIYLRSTSSSNGNVILHGTNIKFWGNVTTDDNNLHIGNGNIVNVKNITSSGTISSTGTGGNVYSGGVIKADGTITGGNISTSGTITATGAISGSSISTGGTLTVTGAISGGSISTGGTITATGNITSSATIQAVTFKASSDYRIKSNCEPLSLTHYNVDLLKPITYYNTILKKQDIGFIAHEVQELYPFLVDGEKDGEKHQSLNYIGMIGILVKEIQELKAKVKRLEENMNIV